VLDPESMLPAAGQGIVGITVRAADTELHDLLAAIEDPEARRADFDKRVERAYESAKAVNAAAGGGLDDVIDPTDTRSWIVRGLQALPPVRPREGKKYPYIDPW
jgi:acetyl-CoA carboxylase carboxyltransferase component